MMSPAMDEPMLNGGNWESINYFVDGYTD
jgi:hypothetical protein